MDKSAKTFGKAIGSAIVQQLIVLTFASMLLDGGVIAQTCLFGIAAFWLGVLIIYSRRRKALRRLDLLFVEAGTIPLVVTAAYLSFAIWRARGVY